MKNKNLKSLMTAKVAAQNQQHEVTVLNRDELLYAMGGVESAESCPMLQSCGTFGDCNDKCGVKGITVGF